MAGVGSPPSLKRKTYFPVESCFTSVLLHQPSLGLCGNMTIAGYFSRSESFRKSFGPYFNCASLSLPRSPAPCSTNMTGYFCLGSKFFGNRKRYGIESVFLFFFFLLFVFLSCVFFFFWCCCF